MDIYVRNICYPVRSLGPGTRMCIWLSGCSKTCQGCMGGHLKKQLPQDKLDVLFLESFIGTRRVPIDGVTISGGEPFDQPEALAKLCHFIKDEVCSDILVYSGYTLKEIEDLDKGAALPYISTLIDGPYEIENDDGVGIRGSSNQQVHQFEHNLDFEYTSVKRTSDYFTIGNQLITAGVR